MSRTSRGTPPGILSREPRGTWRPLMADDCVLQTSRRLTCWQTRMLQATIAVKDLKTAKKFYGDTLGLKPEGNGDEEVQVYRAGSSRVVVYRSQFAGTNKATAATWNLGDEVEKVVNDLKRKGVGFEHYDMPGLTRKGDLHVAGDFKAAWFKDPDGNILALSSA